MDVNLLLSRLQKVKPNGRDKWLACCPAHEDRSPSLAIRVADDGRLLVHCFAGCGAADVIAAVGLDFVDLFPACIEHQVKRIRAPFSADDALKCLAAESGVIAIAVADMAQSKKLTAADEERVAIAWQRINIAMEYVYGEYEHVR